MDSSLRNRVRRRANDRCEYCLLPQEKSSIFRFHIEHIIPKQHGGDDSLGNLALACSHCNLSKGPNLTGVDPQTGEVTLLFHPRFQDWGQHFEAYGNEILGKTPIGRTTVRVLNMNSEKRRRLRAELDRE